MTAYQTYRLNNLTKSMPRGWVAVRLCDDGLLCKTQAGLMMVWQGFNAVNTALKG